ncbi:MAG: hypothetical protein WAX77_04465 [Methylococcaceae bacterium]
MKIFILLVSLLCSACEDIPLSLDFAEFACSDRQNIDSALSACGAAYSSALPLSAIVPQVKKGMSLTQVKTLMAGHKPYLRYTLLNNKRSVWEFHERIAMDNNAINENRLVISIDNQGTVQNTVNSLCFLPDLESPHNFSSIGNCYEKRLFLFEPRIIYDAVKQLLIMSNYQIQHSDVDSLIISAAGTQNMEDANQVMFIKLTVIFRIKQEGTEVIISASFNVAEKQPIWVQAGFAGVSLPVPLPFDKKEEWVHTGIVTPRFYLSFYDTLSALIARDFLSYKDVNMIIIDAEQAVIEPKITAPITPVNNVSITADDSTAPRFIIKTTTPIDTVITPILNNVLIMPKFDGAMDSNRNLRHWYGIVDK